MSYSSLQGIALLLMLGYTMYDLVFDAKLGIIARTLYRAMPDLAHYVVIAMLLVTGVTMASHVTLGPMLPAFDTFRGVPCLLYIHFVRCDAKVLLRAEACHAKAMLCLWALCSRCSPEGTNTYVPSMCLHPSSQPRANCHCERTLLSKQPGNGSHT